MGGSSPQVEARTRASELDFLTAPLGSCDLSRSGGEFVIGRPWAMARLLGQPLRGGWWTLECEGEGDLSGVEVRVSSPRDPLVVFPGVSPRTYRILLPEFDAYDVALLISPWPGRYRVSKLKLRRLSITEEARFLANGVGRLIRSRDPFGVAKRLAQRLIAGQSLGIAMSPPAPPPKAETSPATVTSRRLSTRTERSDGIEAVLSENGQLHSRAFEIAAAEFAHSPDVQAIYADARVGGALAPHPAFDPVLARTVDYVGLPIFFRSGGEGDAWPRLKAIATKAGVSAVRRIPLPLAERAETFAPAMPNIPPPALEPALKVSAIIPTKYRLDLLEKGLAGLRACTGYPNLEIVIVDNGCTDPRFSDVLAKARTEFDLVLVEDHAPFNYSRLVNNGVKRSSGEIVLLLNDDVEPIETGWLHRMVESALDPDAGAVGARLLYPDRTIQHAGVILGIGGVAGHLWKGTPKQAAERNPYIACPSSRLAVTGACLAVRRSVFDQAGGLDEMFPVAFNDIDFCLRLHTKGLRNIYRGDAVLIHHEGQSRGQDDATIAKRKRLAVETAKFLDRWKTMTWDDPYGSPAFDPLSETGAVHRALTE